MLKIMQRVRWNTKGWKKPSGATDDGGFSRDNEFGYEDWNFQSDDAWNDYILSYTYLVPRREKLEEYGGFFDIGFFAKNPEDKKWYFVGVHRNAELIQPGEYQKINKFLENKGIFLRRSEELVSVTEKFRSTEDALEKIKEAFDYENPHVKVKAPLHGVELFSMPILLANPPVTTFSSFKYVEDFNDSYVKANHGVTSSIENQIMVKPSLREESYYRESSGRLYKIMPRHNELSNAFRVWLKKSMKIHADQEKENIDILFNKGKVRYIAELKVVYGVGTRRAIREAMGQLLEYNFYTGREEREQWMIVLDQEPSEDDKRYIKKLASRLNVSLRVGWQAGKNFDFFPKWKIR